MHLAWSRGLASGTEVKGLWETFPLGWWSDTGGRGSMKSRGDSVECLEVERDYSPREDGSLESRLEPGI
jgi:hypothetical protein